MKNGGIMKKKIILFLLIFLVSVYVFADDVLKKADAYRNYSDDGFSFVYTLMEDKDETIMETYVKQGEKNCVLVVYRSPKKLAKRRIFVNDTTFWMYDSKMNSPIRISAQQMLSGQAGAGDISNIIFSKIYEIIDIEEGDFFINLELSIKQESSGNYPKVILTLEKESYKPLKALFYSATDVLLKTVNYTEYKVVEGKELLIGFEIINELNNKKSVIRLSDFDVLKLSDNYFSKEGMKLVK